MNNSIMQKVHIACLLNSVHFLHIANFEVIMSKIKEMILLRGDGTKQKVTVLAINGIWAMVRIRGCVPFVCDVRNLFDIDA